MEISSSVLGQGYLSSGLSFDGTAADGSLATTDETG
jgi:hypothetical protein